MEYEVDYFLVKLSPALTFVLTFIPVLLFIDFDVERRRRVFGFEPAIIAPHLYRREQAGKLITQRKNPAEDHRRPCGENKRGADAGARRAAWCSSAAR